MPDEPLNPIMQRLRKLEGLWTVFIEDPDARILRWLADDDTVQLLQTFVDLQSEPVSTIPDLFIELTPAFDEPDRYAGALIEFLNELYKADRSAIVAGGVPTNWKLPELPASQTVIDVVRVLRSFHQAHEALAETIAIVLSPEFIMDAGQWQDWLTGLAQQKLPATIRFMVTDRRDHLGRFSLDQLAKTQPKIVMSVDPELDMPGAYEQIVADVPGAGPGIDFRKYFVALTNAAGTGDVAKAESAASKAIAIAAQEQWMYLAAAAQMALGAAYFAKQNFDKTLECYRAANTAVAGATDDASKKLDAPTRMAEGSVLIAAGRFGEAAAAFKQAAASAVAQADVPMEVDCWRMAGWCLEQDKKPKDSWECGELSLKAAEKLAAEQRRMSYLSYVGQMLLRLADAGTNRNRRSDVEDRMTELLGPEWDSAIVQGAG